MKNLNIHYSTFQSGKSNSNGMDAFFKIFHDMCRRACVTQLAAAFRSKLRELLSNQGLRSVSFLDGANLTDLCINAYARRRCSLIISKFSVRAVVSAKDKSTLLPFAAV